MGGNNKAVLFNSRVLYPMYEHTIRVIGRGTNNTGSDKSLAQPGAIFFGTDGKVLGFCYGLENFTSGQTTTFEISGDMMSEDLDPSLVDHVEVYIQGDGLF